MNDANWGGQLTREDVVTAIEFLGNSPLNDERYMLLRFKFLKLLGVMDSQVASSPAVTPPPVLDAMPPADHS